MTPVVPRSAYDKTRGMLYFPRMLDKIRRYAAGELREDFHDFLGKGLDGRCRSYLRVDYEALRERTLGGGSDEEMLAWCFAEGRTLNDDDLLVWNLFVQKLAWNDLASESLRKRKAEAGLADRDDIQTMIEFMEVDEGRKA
jgi:gluconokinase